MAYLRRQMTRARVVSWSLSGYKDDAAFLSTGQRGTAIRMTEAKALGYPPIWRAVNLISGSMAKLPLTPYRREEKGREKDATHPAFSLLRRRVNPVVASRKWMRTMALHAAFLGNGYSAVFRRGDGRPAELYLLDPYDTWPQADPDDGSLWYVTRIAGERRRLPARDVLHFTGPSWDGVCGMSIFEMMKSAFSPGVGAQEFAVRFFKQGVTASGVLMIPGHLKKNAQRNVLRYWRRMARGLTGAHKVALLQDGVKWQPISITPEQAQLIASREFEAIQIANVYGIPPHKLGDRSATSYNSLEMENQSWLDDGLDIWLCMAEDECGLKLLTEAELENDTHYLEFGRERLLGADLLTRYRGYSIAKQWGWMSTNEIRRKENMPDIGDDGDIYLQPVNMQEVGLAVVPKGSEDAGDRQARLEPVRAACAENIREALERMNDIAARQLRGSIKRGAEWFTWFAAFGEAHVERVAAALVPHLRVWHTAIGSQADVESAARAWAGSYVHDLARALEGARPDKPDVLGRSIEREIQARSVVDLEAFAELLIEEVEHDA